MCSSELVSESVSDKVTYRAVWGQLKRQSLTHLMCNWLKGGQGGSGELLGVKRAEYKWP